MREEEHRQQRVLYVVSCGSPVAQYVPGFLMQAQNAHWKVCVITTPQGTKFLDILSLESLTSSSERSHYKQPDEPDILPRLMHSLPFLHPSLRSISGH